MFRGYVDQYLTDEIILQIVKTAVNAVHRFEGRSKSSIIR